MIIENQTGEIYEMSLTELINIIQDVYESSALQEEGYFNKDDVRIAIKRVNEYLTVI